MMNNKENSRSARIGSFSFDAYDVGFYFTFTLLVLDQEE